MVLQHNQSTPSDRWVINHNQNSDGALIDVFVYHNGALRKIMPMKIVEVTRNTIEVHFSATQYGTATLAFVL